ncbi:hypothetical protein ACJJTC_000695 [Scirpophaga incertulas]
MDRFRQKTKKETHIKNLGKEKHLFSTDVKLIKENLRLKEILRNVKMNSSMRIKGRRGSKIIQDKYFNDNEVDEIAKSEDVSQEPITNISSSDMVGNDEITPVDTVNVACVKVFEETHNNKENEKHSSTTQEDYQSVKGWDIPIVNLDISDQPITNAEEFVIVDNKDETSNSKRKISVDTLQLNDDILNTTRERKFSLDQTMLSRRKSFSQSEQDLHSIGKSPLERKSSFFRKKLDSFFKNTSEIFKRQSSNRSELNRRVSLSLSLQSLNEHLKHETEPTVPVPAEMFHQSSGSLLSSSTLGHSTSSLSHGETKSTSDQDQACMTSSQPALCPSQSEEIQSAQSSNSLNESFIHENNLCSRAISMNSGLDTAHGTMRRKLSRANRVTWLGSESLVNYLRRVIADEKNKEAQVCQSYQVPKVDNKGRRLSYQRAVSGEDPAPSHVRYLDTSLRKKTIPENLQHHTQLSLSVELWRTLSCSRAVSEWMFIISLSSSGLVKSCPVISPE